MVVDEFWFKLKVKWGLSIWRGKKIEKSPKACLYKKIIKRYET